jgi:DNA polymerase III alpha subunit (gram-positive type)
MPSQEDLKRIEQAMHAASRWERVESSCTITSIDEFQAGLFKLQLKASILRQNVTEHAFPRPYISIDIETTGLDPETCQVIEVGAVIEDWNSDVAKLPSWHCYVDQGSFKGQPYALALNQGIFWKIADKEKLKDQHQFLWPSEVGAKLAGWLESYGFNPKKLLVAGKNFAGFDRPFLGSMKKFKDHVAFRHRVIDPAMLFWNPWTDEAPPDSKTCMKRSGIAGEVAHTAVEDAIGVIKMVRAGIMLRHAPMPPLI